MLALPGYAGTGLCRRRRTGGGRGEGGRARWVRLESVGCENRSEDGCRGTEGVDEEMRQREVSAAEEMV